jgi:hypothetical protein
MRVGQYEVVLIDQDGSILQEVIILGKSYAIAIPGKEYSVKVLVYRQEGRFPAENMRIGL